ncbi:UDP-2,3-diacylglucosamine diphosphatase [Corticibacter populi]|uniref:UDP-2,3-diacylglucosamine hydrolase n=1 Tax=Corticibacter populi TaxID=1550736 RepID=A0A3M6QHK8_9BURK|nr:UDP-2,3-diacylglucosamine diphosphatase [Corticibacter populi]RMX02573.1 UDP-2,3-diacylglucosamine diphosphatase [Corticibacter populi]RZS33017.1 UDP-2,3-diacylglucosamine hydrolase [Corticibacter populi]
MGPALPPLAELPLPAAVNAQQARSEIIDCLADLHLQRSQPATWQAFRRYLQTTPANRILMLGDLFEAWIGDDVLDESGSFEAEVAAVLHAASIGGKQLYFMHGNRDFLIGAAFAEAAGLTLLPDPTVLPLAGDRTLLSHGDALCTDDTDYQRFRALSRNPEWQRQFLAQPLAERRQFATRLRTESETRKSGQDKSSYVDLNTEATRAWLRAADCRTLIHGHTHMPGEHALGDGLQRIVLSDWDLAATPPRADVLRHQGQGSWQRIDLASLAATYPSN